MHLASLRLGCNWDAVAHPEIFCVVKFFLFFIWKHSSYVLFCTVFAVSSAIHVHFIYLLDFGDGLPSVENDSVAGSQDLTFSSYRKMPLQVFYFGGSSTLSPISRESQGLRQLLWYSGFAFGLPLCVTAVSLTLISTMLCPMHFWKVMNWQLKLNPSFCGSRDSDHGFSLTVAGTLHDYRHWFFNLPAGIAFFCEHDTHAFHSEMATRIAKGQGEPWW